MESLQVQSECSALRSSRTPRSEIDHARDTKETRDAQMRAKKIAELTGTTVRMTSEILASLRVLHSVCSITRASGWRLVWESHTGHAPAFEWESQESGCALEDGAGGCLRLLLWRSIRRLATCKH